MENKDGKDGLEGLVLGIELGSIKCDLEHLGQEGEENAVDYIYQKFTYFDVSIPVCQNCIDKLYDINWKLWYCTNCCESHWIHINDSKQKELYKTNEIQWVYMCPKCFKK